MRQQWDSGPRRPDGTWVRDDPWPVVVAGSWQDGAWIAVDGLVGWRSKEWLEDWAWWADEAGIINLISDAHTGSCDDACDPRFDNARPTEMRRLRTRVRLQRDVIRALEERLEAARNEIAAWERDFGPVARARALQDRDAS